MEQVYSKAIFPPIDAPSVMDIFGEKLLVDVFAEEALLSNLDTATQRNKKSMSRAALLLSTMAPELKKNIARELLAPETVGVYCANEQGPLHFEMLMHSLDKSTEDLPKLFKENWSPKQHLKSGASMVGANLSILLGTMGPLLTYTDRKNAAYQALDQANLDLADGRVTAAIVCTVNSLEDPLLTKQMTTELGAGTILSEAIAAVILRRPWKKTFILPKGERFFGIAHPLVSWIQSEGGTIV